MTSPERCGREDVIKSSICDPQNLLEKSEKDILEGKINEFENIQLAIAIIKNMEVTSEDLIDDTSREYAVHLHNTWGVGDAQKQNGILLFLSIKDRVVYISRGNGFKNELNSIVIDLLIAHMRPYLQEGNYGKALEAAVIEINLLINDSKNSQLKSIATKHEFFQTLVYGLMVCVVGGVMYYGYRQQQHEENLRKGEKALNRLLKDVSNETDNKFKFTSCPICLEEFHYPPSASASASPSASASSTTATTSPPPEEDYETKSPNDIERSGLEDLSTFLSSPFSFPPLIISQDLKIFLPLLPPIRYVPWLCTVVILSVTLVLKLISKIVRMKRSVQFVVFLWILTHLSHLHSHRPLEILLRTSLAHLLPPMINRHTILQTVMAQTLPPAVVGRLDSGINHQSSPIE
jgi:hypothetical protein